MNIRKYLVDTLNKKEITDLLADKKVYFLHAEAPKSPYLEYEVVAETGDDYSEGCEDYTTYIVQVDIFSYNSYSKIESTVKKELIKAGFNRDNAVDLYEADTKLYHKAMRFNISLKNED